MVLTYSYCNVSILPLRKEPAHRSEQVSQLLFGEKAEVLEVNEQDWARIRVAWNDYEGWCRASQLLYIGRKEYHKESKYIAARNVDKIMFESSELWLPLGAELTGMKGRKLIVGHYQGRFKGKKLDIKKLATNCEALKHAALHYLHAPYQWGGRSIAGIDCSGLTQMAYKLCNMKLPRDASQQAHGGQAVDFLQHAQCGDLAFFDNEEGKINHVGMLLDAQTILHATDTSGRVVIDKIDPGGIISHLLRKRTHSLRVVKRYI